ncbi:uncharacterized protein LOC102490674 isoform X3 [Tupaia chinensis]|uniref:uncharacterized protein LOC102490674 isoform X3 n=1 Tax=Tupaia chinensis TaxID=246437 RepID=UPI000703FBD9|nr:uncharacterized protein LOC102490674 isoform X3 [Tupaia chinensis]
MPDLSPHGEGDNFSKEDLKDSSALPLSLGAAMTQMTHHSTPSLLPTQRSPPTPNLNNSIRAGTPGALLGAKRAPRFPVSLQVGPPPPSLQACLASHRIHCKTDKEVTLRPGPLRLTKGTTQRRQRNAQGTWKIVVSFTGRRKTEAGKSLLRYLAYSRCLVNAGE